MHYYRNSLTNFTMQCFNQVSQLSIFKHHLICSFLPSLGVSLLSLTHQQAPVSILFLHFVAQIPQLLICLIQIIPQLHNCFLFLSNLGLKLVQRFCKLLRLTNNQCFFLFKYIQLRSVVLLQGLKQALVLVNLGFEHDNSLISMFSKHIAMVLSLHQLLFLFNNSL